jgi:hypothetical protein
MDPTNFDRFVRSLTWPASRRGALGVMVGALALLGQAVPGVAKQRHHQSTAGHSPGRAATTGTCKAAGKACAKNGQCCSGNCTPAPGKTSVAGSGSICCAAGQIQYPAGTCCSGCLPYGTACTADTQCGSGICNTIYAICYQCLPANSTSIGYCTRDAECCPGLTCNTSTRACG